MSRNDLFLPAFFIFSVQLFFNYSFILKKPRDMGIVSATKKRVFLVLTEDFSWELSNVLLIDKISTLTEYKK